LTLVWATCMFSVSFRVYRFDSVKTSLHITSSMCILFPTTNNVLPRSPICLSYPILMTSKLPPLIIPKIKTPTQPGDKSPTARTTNDSNWHIVDSNNRNRSPQANSPPLKNQIIFLHPKTDTHRSLQLPKMKIKMKTKINVSAQFII